MAFQNDLILSGSIQSTEFELLLAFDTTDFNNTIFVKYRDVNKVMLGRHPVGLGPNSHHHMV